MFNNTQHKINGVDETDKAGGDASEEKVGNHYPSDLADARIHSDGTGLPLKTSSQFPTTVLFCPFSVFIARYTQCSLKHEPLSFHKVITPVLGGLEQSSTVALHHFTTI